VHPQLVRDVIRERDVDGFLRTTGMLPPPAVAAAAMPSFPAWAEATCD
jgi:hypothetical protein